MIPTIPSKQLLCVRAITTIVFDKIVDETTETNMLSVPEIITLTSPVNTLYLCIIAYYIHSYYISQLEDSKSQWKYTQGNITRTTNYRIPKRYKMDRLNKYVLTETGYHFIKTCLVILFLLIREPKAVV